jgi:phosphatidylinositol alpha-mannosyltransferase
MRVALVAEDYYPQLGGVPEHVHHLAHELIRRGHTVGVITSRISSNAWRNADDPFVRRIGKSLVIYANGGLARVTLGWQLKEQLRDLLRSGRYDLVHVHGGLAPTFGIVAPMAAFRVGIPVVATFHSWFPGSAAYRMFRRPLQDFLDRHAARIAVSAPVVHALSRYFRADWEVIPNGVDTRFFRPNGRLPEDALQSSPRLLFLGRLEPRNGLSTVLAAMPAILRRHPSAELAVVGDGPWLPYYRWLARPVRRAVRFVGAALRERAELYGSADLYLCPVTRSSFGVTLLEAMACGTPIVASDITGFRELVNGGSEAVLVPDGDPGAWAEAVVGLLSDPRRRGMMSAAGRAKAMSFDWRLVADRIVAVHERVVGR